MTQKRFLLPLLLGVAVALPALAQPQAERQLTRYPPNNPTRCEQTKDVDVAQSHFILGEKAHKKGEFDAAAKEFVAAYEADCTKHDLLVIISRTHEKAAGQEKAAAKDVARHFYEAAWALEAYLERVKDDPEARERKEVIARLKKSAQEAEVKARAAASASAAAAASASASASAPERGGHTIYPWIVVAGGGALVVGGAITWGVGNANKPDGCTFSSSTCNKLAYTAVPPETQDAADKRYAQAQQDAGNAKGLATGGVVLMGAGVLVAAGGVVWHFLEDGRAGGSSSPSGGVKPVVSPAVGPGHAGLQVGGAF